jgi:hypothetical protein
MNTITAKRDFKCFRLYINDSLHLDLLMDTYNGMQSWLEGSGRYNYVIEYYRKNDELILCEYDDKQIWLDILKLIDQNI